MISSIKQELEVEQLKWLEKCDLFINSNTEKLNMLYL